MNVTYTMLVDFARPYKTNTLLVMENDSNSRVCRFVLMDNRKPFEMKDVVVATIKAVKPDGKVVFGNATIKLNEDGSKANEVIYAIPNAITEETGQTVMTVTLLSAQEERITSFEFYVKTRNELYSEDNYAGTNDLAGFRDLLSRAAVAINKIETMAKQTALPNPFPLRIQVGETTYSYNGSETVDFNLAGAIFQGKKKKETSAINWTI